MFIIKKLNISNFNTNKVTNISDMFSGCSSLEEFNLNNFNTNNVTDMIIIKIKAQYKNIKEKAFKN